MLYTLDASGRWVMVQDTVDVATYAGYLEMEAARLGLAPQTIALSSPDDEGIDWTGTTLD